MSLEVQVPKMISGIATHPNCVCVCVEIKLGEPTIFSCLLENCRLVRHDVIKQHARFSISYRMQKQVSLVPGYLADNAQCPRYF